MDSFPIITRGKEENLETNVVIGRLEMKSRGEIWSDLFYEE